MFSYSFIYSSCVLSPVSFLLIPVLCVLYCSLFTFFLVLYVFCFVVFSSFIVQPLRTSRSLTIPAGAFPTEASLVFLPRHPRAVPSLTFTFSTHSGLKQRASQQIFSPSVRQCSLSLSPFVNTRCKYCAAVVCPVIACVRVIRLNVLLPSTFLFQLTFKRDVVLLITTERPGQHKVDSTLKLLRKCKFSC